MSGREGGNRKKMHKEAVPSGKKRVPVVKRLGEGGGGWAGS